MEIKEFRELITDYISENLSEEKQQEFEQFLIDNPTCLQEVEEMKLFWNGVEEDVAPSGAMDVKFYTMLNSQEEKKEKISFFTKLEQLFILKFPKQLAYTLAILTVGFFIGNFNPLSNGTEPTIEQAKTIERAETETENVRSQLVLTLLDQPSANKRLQAVNEVNKLSSVTGTIIKALFSTLNNDANVNVRLSAIEALANYADISLVREGLVASIIHQKSPMVQIALADLMVKLQEKKAVKSFKKLIKEKDVNESAKEKMKESIEQII